MARKRASGRPKAKTGSGSKSKTTAVKRRATAARSTKARTTRASVKKPPSSRGAAKARKGLLERLSEGPVICAEGYLFEFERRGYLQAGAFVPEVVLEHPELVESLHRDFVHAGSDVVEAFTYYAHREKLRIVGRERDLERINRQALRIAKKVAKETGALLAGNICNTNIYDPGDPQSHKAAQRMFDEQIGWAVENGVDFIIGETFSYTAEAELAAKSIKKSGLPAVVTLAVHKEPVSRENLPLGEAAKRLEAAGAMSSASIASAVPGRCCRCSPTCARPSNATWPRFPCLTARRKRSRLFSRSTTRTGTIFRKGGRSRPRSIPSSAIVTRSVSLPRRPTRSACTISVSVVERDRIIFAPWPRRSAGSLRPAATRPT
ncbi:MAG: homocysteine S-methyltransferase family protein [Hyphomicrobiales bacterium]|nr:homocysteine S-methyltransferase family protein [Hyphomicrobiales bacterium]